MSHGEILLTLTVSLVVLGPKELPKIATHLGLLWRKAHQIKEKTQRFWEDQLQQIRLEDAQKKAEEADKQYHALQQDHPSD